MKLLTCWVTTLIVFPLVNLSFPGCLAQETLRGVATGGHNSQHSETRSRSLQDEQGVEDTEGDSGDDQDMMYSVDTSTSIEGSSVEVSFGGTSSASGGGGTSRGGTVRAEGSARVNRTNNGQREFIFEERSANEDFGDRDFSRNADRNNRNNRNRTGFDFEVPGFARGTDLERGMDFDGFLETLPRVEFRRRDREGGNRNRGGEAGVQEDRRPWQRDTDDVNDRRPGSRMFRLFYQNWLEDTTFVDLSDECPLADSESEYPLCVVQRDDEDVVGTWVCRTLYHPVSADPQEHTACIDPEKGLESDVCGCCNGGCPAQCACPCNLRGRGDNTGVRVRVEARTGNVLEDEEDPLVMESCMQFATAIRYTNRQRGRSESSIGRFDCVEECTE